MLNLFLLLSVFLMHAIFTIENKLGNDVNELTKNLFENLKADPILIGDLEFSENSKAFIDRQVENYMNLMLGLQENDDSRSKRSLPETASMNYVDLKPYAQIPAVFAKDIVLFQQNSVWYAVCLESEEETDKYAQTLKIKKYQDNTFQEIVGKDIRNGVRAAAFPLETSTIIVVAENGTARQELENQTSIFMFNKDESLEVIHKINTSYASHVAVWEDEGNVYMSVAQFMRESPHGTRFEVNTPIYKWYGKHFDLIQFIGTAGALKISPFSIGDVHFLAVANSKEDNGDVKTYSEIWKYDMETEKYELLQRILTYACSDIKHFNVNINREQEDFLIVANSYKIDAHGAVSYDALSIIYKFVDDYFIPFQSLQVRGITEWQPVMVENGDVLLLAASRFDGIKCFQYDGWHFVESKTQFENEITSKGINAMHSYKFDDKTVVVVANGYDEGKMANMFDVKFAAENELRRLHKEMLMWCLDEVKNIEDTEILGAPPRGDMDGESIVEGVGEDNSTQISRTIKKLKSELDEIEDKLQHSLQSQSSHVIDHDLTANRIVLNNDGIINFLQVETMNNISVDALLENTLNINEGFSVDSNVEFNLLRIDEPIFPKSINSVPAKELLHKSDNFNIDKLTVDGSVSFLSDIKVLDTVNNITIDNKSVLLRTGDQDFDQFRTTNITVNDLETDVLNKVELKPLAGLLANADKIRRLKELKTKRMIVGGYINDVDISTVQKYALRHSGNQTITENYYFDSIQANNLEATLLSGKNALNDFVPITAGRYFINKRVKFTEDLSVNNLTVLNYLDSIPVKKGRLDILQKDSNESQYVRGIKSFEYLELLNPIKLQGKIRSKDFDTMNPAVTIDSNLDLNRDIRITGDVIVEEIIKSNDIVTPNGTNSLRRLQRQGLKLTDPEIPIHLDFFHHITVPGLFIDRINDIDPGSWVVNGARQTQIIRGWKHFPGDLEITGDTTVFKVNDIDMAELETNVLRQNGDQVISGRHYVRIVGAEKSIKSGNIKFGPHPWKSVITTDGDQVINGTTVFKTNLASNMTAAKDLKITGLINDLNMTNIAGDAATKDTAFKIFSHKTFTNITIDNLQVKNKVASVENLELSTNIDLPNEIEIGNIYFTGRCNGVEEQDFNETVRDDDGMLVNAEDREFGQVTVYGNVYVDSNYVNDVDLNHFENNTVKIDEPFHFGSATFHDIIVNGAIELDGHVEKLDLDNIFQNNIEETQVIIDEKVFLEDVAIEGTVHFGSTLNGFNVSDICEFSSSTKQMKDLIVEGNAFFAKGPNARTFNGYDVRHLQDNVWFKDKPAVLNGNIELNNVTFKDNVTVMGLVNDVNLRLLLTNYLSKSKNQSVAAHMTFLDEVAFADDVATPKLILGGEVNGININEFIKTALLHIPQLFEDAVYFESCTVESVQGNYLVNKMNFENEVMRYDKTNMVTGHKKFEHLGIGNLNNDRDIKVQNVDILNWMKKSVVTDGSSSISGRKYFKNATLLKGISLAGLLNGKKFTEETVMLRNIPQTLTGRKTFITDDPEEIKFKALKVKGLVNNADIAKLVHNQVTKSGDNTFKSEIHLYNNVTAKNVVVEKLYQGVNITELIRNITTLGALSDFAENYRNLLEMAEKIENSLIGQAYFLHYFKLLMYIPIAKKIFGKRSDNGESEIMAFDFENGSMILHYFEWNEEQSLFVDTRGYSINLGPYPTYIEKVVLGDKDYIYFETEKDPSTNEGHTHLGKLLHFTSHPNRTTFEHHSFLSKGTIFVTSFEMETANCLLFIYYDYQISIMCDDPQGEFNLLQSITSETSAMASVININGVPYLVTTRAEGDEPRTNIWRFNNELSEFEMYQTIYEGEPISLTTITYNCGYYLAVAYGHLQNTMHLGRVAITRFNEQSQEFVQWQNINLRSPTHIEFTILPSEEFVLYILTDNPTEPFNVYMYEGISGFKKKIVGSAIPNIINMNQFSINNKHFVVAQHYNEISIIQAIFKGEKLI